MNDKSATKLLFGPGAVGKMNRLLESSPALMRARLSTTTNKDTNDMAVTR